MRILLATEGSSDEIVAGAIIHQIYPEAEIVPKKFPAPGFPMVKRLLPDVIRAAHFGFYDLMVVHFDIDDTLPGSAQSVKESPRWQEINDLMYSTIPTLKDCNRPTPLEAVLMAPIQSTDSWLCWGEEGGEGNEWERKSRHTLKEKLYGKPPIMVTEKAKSYIQNFLNQLSNNSSWPSSLKEFYSKLESAIKNKIGGK